MQKQKDAQNIRIAVQNLLPIFKIFNLQNKDEG